MKEVVIVVPLYKPDLSPEEQISLNHLRQYCSHFPLVIVHPIGLTFHFDTEDFRKIALSPRHFRSVSTYSRLCMNPRFYRLFSDYRYLLLYQTDAYIFRDELSYWCKQNYSYIGAPWLKQRRLSRLLEALHIPHRRRYAWEGVGNGGLSLRKIEDFQKVLQADHVNWLRFLKVTLFSTKKNRISLWKMLRLSCEAKMRNRSIGSQIRKAFRGNEDRYWFFYGAVLNPAFKLPPSELANYFAIDYAILGIKRALNKGKMPFGGHACLHPAVRKEWMQNVDFIR